MTNEEYDLKIQKLMPKRVRIQKHSRGTDKTQCRSCFYRETSDPVLKDACMYLVITGRKRPCEPSPDCTVYIRGGKI